MRLTNEIRDRIIRHIMQDVPVIDYESQIRARAVQIGVEAMPPTVRKVYDDPKARHFIRVSQFYIDCMTLSIPGLDRCDSEVVARVRNDERLNELHKLHDDQRDARIALGKQLKANVYSCSTRKQFVDSYPDLAKYAPELTASVPNLPASTALVDALKAAGLQLADAA